MFRRASTTSSRPAAYRRPAAPSARAYADDEAPVARRRQAGAAPKKKRRMHPGTVALREIRRFQKYTGLLVRKLPFQRLVKSVLDEAKIKDMPRIQGRAIEGLQYATELWLMNIGSSALKLAHHAKRKTLARSDLFQALQIGEDLPGTSLLFQRVRENYDSQPQLAFMQASQGRGKPVPSSYKLGGGRGGRRSAAAADDGEYEYSAGGASDFGSDVDEDMYSSRYGGAATGKGKGKGGKGKGAVPSVAVRHKRKKAALAVNDAITSITRGDIRRILRRAGVARMSGNVYDGVRTVLRAFLFAVLRPAIILMDHDKMKTVTSCHIARPLKDQFGIRIAELEYGVGRDGRPIPCFPPEGRS